MKLILMFRYVCWMIFILAGNPCTAQSDLKIVYFTFDKQQPLLVIEQPRNYSIQLDMSMIVGTGKIKLNYNISIYFKDDNDDNVTKQYNDQVLSRPQLTFTRPANDEPREISDTGDMIVLTLPGPTDKCKQINQFCVQVLPVSITEDEKPLEVLLEVPPMCIPLDETNIKCDRPQLELGLSQSPQITAVTGTRITFDTALHLRYIGDYYASFNGTSGSLFRIDVLSNTTDETEPFTSIGNIKLIGDQYQYHLSATSRSITFNLSETVQLYEGVDLCNLDGVNAICFNVTPGENSTFEPIDVDQNNLQCATTIPKISKCGLIIPTTVLVGIVAALVVLLFIIMVCIVCIRYRQRISESQFWVHSKSPEETYNIIRKRLNVKSFYDRKPYVVDLSSQRPTSSDLEKVVDIGTDEGRYDHLKRPVPVVLMSEDGSMQFNMKVNENGTINSAYDSIDENSYAVEHSYEPNLQSVSGGSASSNQVKVTIESSKNSEKDLHSSSQDRSGSSEQDLSGGSYVQASAQLGSERTRQPSIFPVKPDLPRLKTKKSGDLSPAPEINHRPSIDFLAPPPSPPSHRSSIESDFAEDVTNLRTPPPPPPMKIKFPEPKTSTLNDTQTNPSDDRVPCLPDAATIFNEMSDPGTIDLSAAQYSSEQETSGGRQSRSDERKPPPPPPKPKPNRQRTSQDRSSGEQPPPPPPKPKFNRQRTSQDGSSGEQQPPPPPPPKPKSASRPPKSKDRSSGGQVQAPVKHRSRAPSGIPIVTLTGGGSTKAVADIRRPSLFRTNSSENLTLASSKQNPHQPKGLPDILQKALDTSFQIPSDSKSKRSSGMGTGTSTLKKSQAEFATLVLENYLSIIDELGNPAEEAEPHDYVTHNETNTSMESNAANPPRRLRPMSSIRRNSTPFLLMEQRKMSIMSAWSEGSEMSDMSENYVNKWNKKWEFDREELILDRTKPLGEGQFGKVYTGVAKNIADREGDTRVAVKELKNDAAIEDKDEFLKELAIHTLMDPHVNVIELLGCCIRDEPLCIIIEFMQNGDMLHYLRRQRRSEPLAQYLMVKFGYQIACGMDHVSNMGIVHRDLAARNILVSEHMVCKVSDFGFARDVFGVKTYDKSPEKGPIRWYAPESILDDTFTTKTDVWSFGILLFEIITMGYFLPYHKDPTAAVRLKIATGGVPPRPPYCNDELYRIMKSCWSRDPDDRPEFSQLAEILASLEDKYEPVSPFGETDA